MGGKDESPCSTLKEGRLWTLTSMIMLLRKPSRPPLAHKVSFTSRSKPTTHGATMGLITQSHLRLTRPTVIAMKMALLTSTMTATMSWVHLPMTGKVALTLTAMDGQTPKLDGCHKTAQMPFSSNRRSGLTAITTTTATNLMATRATIAPIDVATLHWTVLDALIPTATATRMRILVVLMA